MKGILILLGFLFLFSCNDFCDSCTDENLIGEWLVDAAIGNVTQELIYYPENITEQTITFNSDRYFSNNCNIRGKYLLKDGQIKFYDVRLTEMYCNSIEFMDWEQMLFQNLEGDCDYEINEDELRITTLNAYSFGLIKHN